MGSDKGTSERVRVEYEKTNGAGFGADLVKALRGTGPQFEQAVRDAFYQMRDRFKDEYRELESELERERQKRRELQRMEDERRRLALRDRRDLQKSVTSTRRWALGMSTCSMMLVLGLGADRVFESGSSQSENEVVEQLKARIDSYDTLMQARETQLERYMYSENDKFAALLKAVDGLKNQVGHMDWYLSDEGRQIMTVIKDYIKEKEAIDGK